MQKWEKTLDILHRQGWGYGYARCLDAETGGEFYLVNLNRQGERLSSVKPTMDEAVASLSCRVSEATGMETDEPDGGRKPLFAFEPGKFYR